MSASYPVLNDYLLPPPVAAALSVLIVAGTAQCGGWITRKLRGAEAELVDYAAAFVLAASAIAATVHLAALIGAASVAVLRPPGWALAVLGLTAIARVAARRRSVGLSFASFSPGAERWAAMAIALIALGLLAAALGPPTDADSLDYHLGVPLEWLRHGGAFPTPDWFTSRLVGLGENLNLLGLASGTDTLGAAFQAAGLIAAIAAVASLGRERRDRVFGALLVIASPVVLFLVPNQKPQMLPTAATTVAIVLAVKRWGSFRFPEALLCSGAIAFAVAAKHSFILTGAVAAAVCAGSAAASGFLKKASYVAAAAILVLVVPIYARNLVFYGDPLSPFLEPFRLHPDQALVAFGSYLRDSAGERTLRSLARLPVDMVVTLDPGALSIVLGLGTLAFVTALPVKARAQRVLLIAALAACAIVLAMGQMAPRFFLEPYLWAAAAAVAAEWRLAKRVLFRVLIAQGFAVGVMASVGAATLFPGALTTSLRDRVMTRAAHGYAEMKWLDERLPSDAVILTYSRSAALIPRRSVRPELLVYAPNERVAADRLTRLLAESGVTALVTPVDLPFMKLKEVLAACSAGLPERSSFPMATRNPFNRTPGGEVQLTRLGPDAAPCARALP